MRNKNWFETQNYNPDEIISLAAASKLTGYHQDYLGQLCRSGKLEGKKVGRNWVTTYGALAALNNPDYQTETSEVESIAPEPTVPVTPEPELAQPAPVVVQQSASVVEPTEVTPEVTSLFISAVEGSPIELRQVGNPHRNVLEQVKAKVQTEELKKNVEKLAARVETLEHQATPAEIAASQEVSEPVIVPAHPSQKFVSNFNIPGTQKMTAEHAVIHPSYLEKIQEALNNTKQQIQTPWKALVATAVIVLAIVGAAASPVIRGKLVGNNSAETISYPSSVQQQPSLDVLTNSNTSTQTGEVNPQGEVLGTQVVVRSAQQPVSQITEDYIDRLILFNLENVIAQGWIKGEKGDPGPAGPAGQAYAPISYYPSPTPGQGGSSLFAATDISAQHFYGGDFSGTNINLSGNLTVAGTITGSLAVSLDPGFPVGSVIFQGGAGLANDSTNFFWDDTANALGLGTATPAASSILDLSSTTKGFLAPRMTTGQRDAISTPATGLLIFNTTTNQFNVYSGGTWNTIAGGGGSSALSDITAASGNTTIANSANNIVWNWQLTGAEAGFTFGETAASTGGSGDQYIVDVATVSGSTAIPLFVNNLGNGISFRVDDSSSDATPFVIDASGNVGIGTASPATALHVATGSARFDGTVAFNSTTSFQANDIQDSEVSDTLTSSIFIGSGSSTNAIDLGTAEVAGTLGVGNGGTGAGSFTTNGVLFGNGSNAVQVTSAATAGQVLLGNGSSVPTFTTLSGDVTVSGTGVTTIGADSVALGTDTTGNYVATISAGSGISGSSSSEGGTPTISLGVLTADWNQTGAFDIVLNNAASELRILESVGGTFYGILDIGDLSADATYTFSGTSGTVLTSANYTGTLNGVYLQIANNLSDLNNVVTARSNLGLGTIATQDANNVTITGGSINGTTIGASTPATGSFTTLQGNSDVDFTFNGTENFAITTDLAGSVNVAAITATPSASAGTTRGFYVQQANSANTNGLDAGFYIDNADTDLAIPAVLEIANTGGGGYTNIINNQGTLISGAELNLLDGHDAALIDINDAVSTAIVGTGALNSGSITSGFGSIDTGSDSITTTGTITGGTVNATTVIQLGGVNINTAGTLSNVAYLNQAQTFSNTNTFSSASPLVLSNTNPIITLGASDAVGVLTIKDSAGSPNTLFTLTDNGTSATLLVATINASSLLQTNGTTRIDSSGNLTNIGNLTATGAITIASTGATNDVIIDGADQFIVQDSSVFNGTVAFNSTTTFQANDIQDAEVSDTLTASIFIGSGSTTNAVDLGTAEVAGTLGVGKGGTGLSTIASGKLLYASALDTLAELTLGSTLSISTGTINVVDNTSIQKVTVRKNTGANVGSRQRLNFIEGSNITITTADDSGSDEIDITIAATGSTGYTTVQDEGSSVTQRSTINFIGSGVQAVDNAGSTRTDVTIFDASASQAGVVTTGSQTFAGAKTFQDAMSLTLSATENFSITSDLAGSTDLVSVVGTPSASAGTTRGIFVQQANSANTNGLDVGAYFDNADTDLAIPVAIQFANTGGAGYTNIFDILGTQLSAAELTVLDGGIDLGTDTNGNYVATITAGTGLTGDATGEGSTPTISVNTASGVTTSGDDVVLDTNFNPTWTNSHTWTLAGTENLSVGSTTGSNSVDIFSLSITNNDAGVNTQRGIVITNLNDAANAVTEAALVIDNAETTVATLTDAILITSSGVNGGVVDAIDASDSNIDNAINIGANAIAGTNFNVSGAGAVVAVGVNYGSGLLQGTGGMTITGTSQINATGTAATTIGNSSAGAMTLQGSTVAITSNGAGNDVTLTSADQIILNAGSTIEIQDNTNIAGNLDVSGTLAVGTADALTVNASGTVTIATGQSYTGAGTVTLSSAAASSLTINSGTTGTINIGDDSSAETINIATGNAAKTLVLGSTNSTSSTTIQSGTGDITLQARGSGTSGSVFIGEAGGTPDILVVGTKTTAGNPSGTDGGIYYNSNAGKFFIQESGTWKEVCNKSDAACGAGSGSAWSALTAPSGNLSLSMNEFTTGFAWDTAATAAAKDYFSLNVTNDASTDSTAQRLLVLANNDSTGSSTTENLLVLDNADTDEAVTKAIEVTSAAGGITTAIDVSDANIGIALEVGANPINATSNNLTIQTTTSGNIILNSAGGTIELQDATNVTGNLDVSGTLAVGTGDAFTVDASGNITKVGNITGTGAITIASTGAGNDVIIDGADQFIVQDAAVFNSTTTFNGLSTFNTDVDFTFAGTENINLTSTVTSTTSVDLATITLTNQTTSGTQRGVVITNADDAANAVTESAILIDNAETTAATLTDAIKITSSGVNGGIVDGLDVSDSNIDNAINIGANAIAGTNFNVSGAGALVAVGVNSGTGLIQGTGGLTVSGITQINTSGTADTTIGNSSGGTITIGASSGSDLALQDAQWSVTGAGAATFASVTSPTYTGTGAVTLSSGGSSALTLDSASDTIVIAASDTTLQRTAAGTYTINLVDSSNTTLALTNSGAGNLQLSVDSLATGGAAQCLQANSNGVISLSGAGCGTGSITLQQAYDAGNTITTTDARNISITLANTTTDQTFEITQAGTAIAFRVNDDGTFSDSTPFVVDDSGKVGIGTATPTGTFQVERGTYTTNLAVFNNGVTGTPPTYPNSYVPTLVVQTDETSASRPLFFGYNNAGSWDAYLNAGACGSFTQMCLNLGTGANDYTALQNVGTTLRVGGGDDGNFTDVSFQNSGTVIIPDATGFQTNDITPTSALTVGATGQSTTVQGSSVTLDSASNTLTIAASDTILQRTAAGTYTINLVDGSDTTLAITNSGAGNAILQVDSLAGSGTRCLQTDASGNISALSTGCSGSTTLQQAYDADANSASADIVMSANDGDIIFHTIGGATDTSFQIVADSAPEEDMVALSNSGFGTVTTGVDLLSLNFTQADDADGTDTNSAIDITVISSSGDGDTLNGIRLAGITPGAATENAIDIGSGWDKGINITSTGSITAGDRYGFSVNTGNIVTSGNQAAFYAGLLNGGTAGTSYGLFVAPTSTTFSGATMVGVNIQGLSTSGGTDNALTIGANWDTGFTIASGNNSIDTAGASDNGLSIDIQSSSSSQNALLVTSNNGSITGLIVRGDGKVGIGDSSPNSLFTVGSGDLFQINSSGQIGSQQAPISDYLFALAGTTGNDNSRIIDITQANDANEDSRVISVVNTVNRGTVTGSSNNIVNQFMSLTPTLTTTNSSINIYGLQQAIDLSGLTLGNSQTAISEQSVYGDSTLITGTPVINQTNADFDNSYHNYYGNYVDFQLTPTLTAITSVTGSYIGSAVNATVTSSGNTNYSPTVQGLSVSASGNLTTTGSTSHYAGVFSSSGTADTNIGIQVTASGATTNYAAIFMGGNVGIGDATPAALFTVGSGDLFQVDSAGVVTLLGNQTRDIQTANASTANNITLQPGVSSAATGTGAALLLSAGEQSGGTSGTGGTVSISGGNATGGGTTTGGAVEINGGTGSTSGEIRIGATVAGDIKIGIVNSAKNIFVGGSSSDGIYIGTSGTTGKTISIGTNAAASNTIAIGGAASNLTLTDDSWSISNTGVITSSNLATGGAAQCLQADTSGVIQLTGSGCGSAGGTRLDQITAATTTATINSNTNSIVWNWALGAGTNTGFTIGEDTAATSTSTLFAVSTVATSTANPFVFTSNGTADGIINLASTGDFVIKDNGTTFASFSDTGGVAFSPQGSSNVTVAADLDSNFQVTLTNSSTSSSNASAASVTLNDSGSVSSAFPDRIILQGTATTSGTISGSSASKQIYGFKFDVTDSSTVNSDSVDQYLQVFGGSISTTFSGTAGHANDNIDIRGLSISAIGDITNVGTTSHTGVFINSVVGSADNNIGLRVGSVSGADNNYGIYLGGPSSGSTNWALYSPATAQSYFAGNVGIGVTTPTQKLAIADGGLLINTTSAYTPSAKSGAFEAGAFNVNSVVVSGKYLYMGKAGNDTGTCTSPGTLTACELAIFDISNPNSMTNVAGINITDGVNAIAVSGKYLYFGTNSNGSANELRIYDISNPGVPSSVTGISYDQNLNSIWIQGKILFLGFAGDNSTGTEVKMYDISNPASPVALGSVDTAGSSGGAGGVKSIYVNGKYMYLGLTAITGTCTGTGGTATGCEIRIYDISDPVNPTYKAGVDATVDVNTVALSGKYLYTGWSTISGNDLRIYDVSDGTIAPTSTGGIDLSTGVNSLQVQGRYVYTSLVSDGSTGKDIQIIDASDPTAPVSAGGVDVSTGSLSTFVSGKYWYVGLSQSASNDVRIYDTAGIDTPVFAAGSAGVGQLQVTDNARIENELTVGSSINVGLGGITSSGNIVLENSTTGSTGGNGIAGIYGSYTMSNNTASTFLFGNRFLNTITGSQAATNIGTFIRMTDNSTQANTVRGLEVQAYSGSNTNGVNTGIASFGKTFGLQAETTAEANGTLVPAAIFAYLNNGSASTSGNAIRAFTDQATSADLVRLSQNNSTFSGTGLLANFADGSGSFTGNFVDFQKAGTSKFKIDNKGQLTMTAADADNAESLLIDTLESTGSQNIFRLQTDVSSSNTDKFIIKASGAVFVSLPGTQTTRAVCHTNSGTSTSASEELVDCDPSAGADFAEMYPVETGIEVGDVVATGNTMVNTYNQDADGTADWNSVKGQIAKLTKSTAGYQGNLIGVVSDNYTDFATTGYNIKSEDNPKSVALSGRVLVKTTTENGIIQPGDYLTASNTQPGFAMKATSPGMVIGQALGFFDGTGGNTVMVFVNPMVYDPTIFVNNDNNSLDVQRGTMSTQLFATTTSAAAYMIDQQGSADILQLQNNGVSRMLVRNNGSISINTTPTDGTETLFAVNTPNDQVLSINAHGDLTIKGVLVVKDDSFAGSVVTQADGTAEITFTNDLGTGKPSIQLTPEADHPVFAQVLEWKKDDQGRYTGFVMKTFGLDSQPTQSIVHYLVVAKEEGYETFGLELLQVTNQPNNNQTISSGGGNNGGGNSGGSETSSTPEPETPPAPPADTSSSDVPPTSDAGTETILN